MTARHRAVREPGARHRGDARRLRRVARRALVTVGGAGTVALLAGGPVFAFYTVAGAGSSSGTTGTVQPLTLSPATVGSPSSTLLPGGTADLLLNVTNPNAVAVTITGVAQGGGVTVSGGSGCSSDPAWPTTTGNSGVAIVTTTGLSISVPGGSTATVHVTGAASMTNGSASGCQGAAFQIPVTVTVTR
ncbi:MAG: hypothetical protein KDB63_03800 [Nocardioidaceae bacterium]|nr:hypothetical protein [Nocardioidaceae bacterium]